MKVFAIIPAHNESEGIERTILSIVNQSYSVEKIVVACDNCTDDTELICERMSKTYPSIEYFATINNKNKKSGALNQAFKRIKSQQWGFLLQMDADTILKKDLISEGIKELVNDHRLGGVCARFRIKDYEGGNFFLYTLQYLEYSFFDSIQIEKKRKTHVLSGTTSLLRREAIISFDFVWPEDSIVEDYALTLNLKKNNWQVRVGKNMHILTDYMKTWKSLWRQRTRWIYGTIEEIKRFKRINYSQRQIVFKDSIGQKINLMFGVFQVFFITGFSFLIFTKQIQGWHPIGIVVLAVVFLDRLYRSKYIKKKNVFNIFVATTLVWEYLYSLFLIACMFSCHFRVLMKLKPKW